jgi:hypothetical protein
MTALLWKQLYQALQPWKQLYQALHQQVHFTKHWSYSCMHPVMTIQQLPVLSLCLWQLVANCWSLAPENHRSLLKGCDQFVYMNPCWCFYCGLGGG